MSELVKRQRQVLSALGAVLVVACGSSRGASGEVVVTERESPNYTVFVIEDAEGVRRLRFERDGVDQSAVLLGEPDHLVFAYMRGLTAALALKPDAPRVLIIGLGGGTLPMFIRAHRPDAHIDVVEIDPVVIDVARKDLGFVEDPALVAHLADGRKFIEESAAAWDLIVLDAYGPNEIPSHLATRQFYEAAKRRLAPGGLLAANLWSEAANKRYRSMLRTFEAVFPEVHVIALPWSESRIVLALDAEQGLTKDALVKRAEALKKSWELRFDLPMLVRRGHIGPDALPRGGTILID